MADYRLTQSGDEVQNLLDQVTPNQQAIEGLQSDKVDKVDGKGLSDENFTEDEKTKLGNLPTQSELNTELGKKATIVSLGEETEARESADQTLQQHIDAEETRAKAAEKQNAYDIDAEEAARIAADNAINEKIPAAASAQNQLADKQFVNQSIQTATAVFRGTYNLVSDLHLEVGATRAAIIAALGATISGADNNDYCFVQIPTATATPTEIAAIDRYKFNGLAWAYEYTLNNSGFTAAQWDAINSTITSGLVAKLSALPTNAELTTLLAGKQAVIADLETIRTGAAAGATAYQKPGAGIPKTDLTSGVQTSLDKAELAAPQATTYTKTEVDGLIGDEETRARAAEQANAGDISTIEGKIPAAASNQNQLADKNFVNQSIATNTAQFKGSYNEVSDLHLTTDATRTDIAAELGTVISGADNNDYAFVQIPTDDATPSVIARVERYKFNGTAWAFEYELNNSGFTAAQWNALNSGITSGLVAKLTALPTNAELTVLLNGKQAVIADLDTIRSGAQAGATAVQPATLASEVSDLEAADTAEATRAQAAEQAINDKIPSGASSQNKLVDAEAIGLLLAEKQNTIQDLSTIRSGAAAGASAYQKPASGIPETDLTVELQLALASFITATAQNLAYYYLKSETYSAAQVDQMIAAIKQFQYESVAVLPEASAQTVGKIYLVPSDDPQTQNTKDEYITLTTVEEGTTTYSWEKIGSTTIDLSNYYTKAQTDAAITAALNNTLASYSTTTQVSTMISTAINSALQAYATKEYVSSQVQEYAGTFRGTYNSLAELEATTGNHHNDYAWVKVTDSDGDNDYDRYKYNGSAWIFEYRLNNTHFTAAELASIRSGMTTAKREKLDALPTNADLNTKFYALTRHTRLTDFDLNVLKQAVADQNLEKYGLKPGDQKTINGHTYVIAGLNPMKGTTTPYRVTANHVGLIVIPHTTQKWNESGNTSTGADSRGAGYMNCDLHYYLKNTLLPLVETDLGAANLIGHSKLLTNAVNTTGINRFGEATGCSSGWTWEANCKICALSEVQVYGGTVWSSSGYDTGEACRQLDVFQAYSHTEIFGGEYPWLRDVVSASLAAFADNVGCATYHTASHAYYVAALILFH